MDSAGYIVHWKGLEESFSAQYRYHHNNVLVEKRHRQNYLLLRRNNNKDACLKIFQTIKKTN